MIEATRPRLQETAAVRESCPVEALLLVVAELMTIPLLIAGALLFEAAGVAVITLGQAIAWRSARPSRLLRWWRRLLWTLTGVVGFVLTALIFVDLVLYEPGLRLLLDQVERSSGVDVCFERGRGNLFTGVVHLEGVTVRHRNGADVALAIDSLDIDIAMLRIFSAEVPIESLHLMGVRGAIVRNKIHGDGQPPGHRFVVEHLVVDDLAIDFEDLAGGPVRVLPLAIEHLEVTPLRSRFAVVDLLCHTRAEGRARGSRFSAGGGGWKVEGIALGGLGGPRLGAASKWIRGGALDVAFTCRDAEADPLVLRVDVGVTAFQLVPPLELGRRTIAQKLAGIVSNLGPRIDLRLDLEIGRRRLDGAASAAHAGLWDLGVQAFNLELTRRLGLGRDELAAFGLGARSLDAAHQRIHAQEQPQQH